MKFKTVLLLGTSVAIVLLHNRSYITAYNPSTTDADYKDLITNTRGLKHATDGAMHHSVASDMLNFPESLLAYLGREVAMKCKLTASSITAYKRETDEQSPQYFTYSKEIVMPPSASRGVSPRPYLVVTRL